MLRLKQEFWKQNAYPSGEAVTGMREQGQANLATHKAGAYQQMASNLASRGIGPGSGVMQGESEGIEKGYLEALGGFNTELTKFQHTPQFAPGGHISPTNMGSTYQGGEFDMLNTAMGMMMAQQMFGGWGGGGGNTNNMGFDDEALPSH